jgi:hypothetical protein
VLKSILNQAFNQYIFDKVDATLSLAGTTDVHYSKAVKDVSTTLDQLMVFANELKTQHPELISLVLNFESVTAIESILASEIAYRQGLRDSNSVRQEFITFIEEEYDKKVN